MDIWIYFHQQTTSIPNTILIHITTSSVRRPMEMFHPLIPGLLYPVFLLVRAIVHLFRNICWKLSGSTAASSNATRPDAPMKCAHVLKVKWRFKFDVLIQSNKPEDFVLFHESFEYPEYVLKDEITLYHINTREAMFVECQKGSSVWDLREFSFSKEAQFRLAEKVIIMPIGAAKKLVYSLGRLRDKIIFMGNTSRCGSTLLCRMFQSTGHYISYVEPGVLGDLMPCVEHEDDPDVAEYIMTTLTLLCKPCQQNPAIEGHVIKIATSSTKIIQCLHKLLPKAHYLFVYRNLLPVMKSVARIVPSLPYTHLYSLLNLLSAKWAENFSTYHNRYEEHSYLDEDFVSPYRRIIPLCLQAVLCYFSFLKQGISICAVRYEDLIQDPEGSLKSIFSVCDIHHGYIPKALIPLDHDAQEKSALSGTKIVNLKIPEFTDVEKEQVRKMCECYGIPNILIDKVYPHTVTLSGSWLRK
ncbi:hypothetical protein LSH36_178g06000 [Paralvinella palmiformis]|uniref:Sulfotransferase n=1 Tax=Paralvinella palmiformis TaxID=53620 RepID=A0AAD9N5R0_9ANNE|nr:hypothetical protein LSH36_178g06000 [Paralvinella palmiformis]